MKTYNEFVCPLLTDLYQLTMAYGYWKSNKHNNHAVFELFFRKNPFQGEFTLFAGLEEVLRFISKFRFTEEEIDYLQKASLLGDVEAEFYEWLKSLDCSKVKIFAIQEGSIVFPREPLIRVEGPLAICQLLETTLLNLVNYASLMTTNAARFRLAAGHDKSLLEFGLRRAQGPDGGVSASRYSYLGGFDATSNVLAGKLFGVPVKGTNAHSFISSFSSIEDLKTKMLKDSKGKERDFVQKVLEIQQQYSCKTNQGELAAFIAYAQAFPKGFLSLVDTYDTLRSGIPNFFFVAMALIDFGYKPIGVRLDSGDLAYLSKEARKIFHEMGEERKFSLPHFMIVASNDINEQTLMSLKGQGHEIDTFGIGTHLVTCQAQPALGCVYKLVEINNTPRLKLSQEPAKITIPGKKEIYRLLGQKGYPLLDLMICEGDEKPKAGKQILCHHPFKKATRVNVTPTEVERLDRCYWDGELKLDLPSIKQIREYVLHQLKIFRPDHLRRLNPTPYKLSVNQNLFQFFHDLWLQEAPIAEIN